MKSSQSKATRRSPEEETSLKEFFIESLKDIYWAEKHLTKNMPKLAKAATSEELKSAFEEHLTQTETQVGRLEKIFANIDEKPVAVKCEAMEGLVKEAQTCISDTDNGTMTRDVALIAAGQKIEHYEIASYGTLRTLASVLGFKEVADLLNQTLGEEKKADYLLTQIAEGFVNQSAMEE